MITVRDIYICIYIYMYILKYSAPAKPECREIAQYCVCVMIIYIIQNNKL